MKITVVHPFSLNHAPEGSTCLTLSTVIGAGTEVEIVNHKPLELWRDKEGHLLEPKRWILPVRVEELVGMCLYLDKFIRTTFPGIELPEIES